MLLPSSPNLVVEKSLSEVSEPPDPRREETPSPVEHLVAAAIEIARSRRVTPGATYRFQFNKSFTLKDAIVLVPYLSDLGITHLYASPILKARPGSMHGYDVVDHGELNPEVGTEEEFASLASALRERGMGLILDAVPNHMCIGGDNPWWTDVLEHGPSSPYAEYFDIAWYDSPRPGMSGRLLLPVLGEPYGTVLESGQLRPAFGGGAFSVWYYDNRLPIDPRTYGHILAPAVAELLAQRGVEDPDTIELTSILNSVGNLPPRGEPEAGRVAMGRVEIAAIKRRLLELGERFPHAAGAVANAVAQLAGTPGDPASFGPLDDLLEAQAYRPAFWRVASDEINYRRFFDVNELAAMSTEREEVFRAVHRKLLDWLAAGQADGLRIDHPDGLFDPKQYLDRLQTHYMLALARREYEQKRGSYPNIDWERDEPALLERFAQAVDRFHEKAEPFPLFVSVEKILAEHETLPPNWACDGATGYKFLNAVNNLFVDPASEGRITRLYHEFTGMTDPFPEVVYEKKGQILSSSLASELNALAHQLDRLARLDRRSRDFTLNGIRRALREVIASFPVYRSYVNGEVHDTDKAVIGQAISRARRRNPNIGTEVLNFIRDTLLLKDSPSGPASEEYRNLQRHFAGKFQQVTAPVTAKGIEDTAFYVFNRFISLNEVGGEPGRFGWTPGRLHEFMLDRHERTTGPLSPLSTHDTKRSEDPRARLNVLSEIPGEWADRVGHWSNLNKAHRTEIEEGTFAPDANEEYLLYQSLVGVWPASEAEAQAAGDFKDRIQAFMKKALCEAKVHSSWINPDPDYEAAVAAFIDAILDPEQSGEFLADLGRFVEHVAACGRINSLAQTVIRCTAPGIPDTYQGTDCWDFSLVDPDNRRPVDYESRGKWLGELKDVAANGSALADFSRNLACETADPRSKLFTTWRALNGRRRHRDLFSRGDYVPLVVEGPKADHVFAFLRTLGNEAALVAVPRMTAALATASRGTQIPPEAWEGTRIHLPEAWAGREWTGEFDGTVRAVGDDLPVAETFANFPVAIFIRREQ